MEATDVGLWKRVVDAKHGASEDGWMGAAMVGMRRGGRCAKVVVGDKAEWWVSDEAIFLGGD